jgi:hypothetical protein
MVICDGFNHLISSETISTLKAQTSVSSTSTTINSIASPFPRPPVPQPPARQMINNSSNDINHNGNEKSSNNGYHNGNGNVDTTDSTSNSFKINKAPPPPPPAKLALQVSSSSCNYDNLRSIDSDDSHITSPEPLNGNNHIIDDKSKLSNSNSFTNSNIKNGVDTTTISVTQQQPSSMPITDKSIMNNIMNKTMANDSKSQSMFTNNSNNSNINTINGNAQIASVSY